MCFVCEAPEEIESVLEGRTCQYDNEILITDFVADDLGLQIGDTVTVAENDKKEEYMVSGIYQCANDMGSNFAMSKAGYERVGNQRLGEAYCLKNPEKAKDIAEKLNERYGTELKVTAERGFSGIDSIVSAVNAVSVLVYVLAVIFALVVISLVCGKIFAKERQDYGIYKAMGFTSGNLRLQFALRFMLVSMIGSILGVVLTILLMNKCFGLLLSYVGISQIETEIAWISVLIPIGMMAVVFFLFSYWKAGKIKRVQPRVLISE
ncbi:ABC transporter permease [Roseburia sp. 499]|uniref:ABC transporter permease n=1 Tax=Roseburia sp. 499 TaxID=1261634 RepID=UPI000950B834|nr:FtsX-like permease family protein [Roseburia sp. 499]WVK69106.1 FtsX-like permease family protein [Roseburia sp. 499]